MTTRLGSLEFERAYYYDLATQKGVFPFDQWLKIDSEVAVSESVSQILCGLSARMPYAEATTLMKTTMQVDVSTWLAWKRAQDLGTRARPAMRPFGTGKLISKSCSGVSICIDGFMCHLFKQGWKEVKTAVICELFRDDLVKPNPHGRPVFHVHATAKSHVAHFGDPDGLVLKLMAEVASRKIDQKLPLSILGDGARWIWAIAEHFFPDAAHIVDWYHAKQHLYVAADLLFPNQLAQQETWVAKQSDLLYNGQATEIAATLTMLSNTQQSDTRIRLLTEAGYFMANHQRMQYASFQEAGLPIGSGVVEAAAKQFQHRVKASGMHWSEQGLHNILALRSAALSDASAELWRFAYPR